MNIHNLSSIYPRLVQDYQEILLKLIQTQYIIESIPEPQKAEKISGEAFSLAHPIQGLLKYHGMFDPVNRIAFFPSISLNNGAISTITYLKFDPYLTQDKLILNGVEKSNNLEYNRVVYQLNLIRKYSNIETKAIVISKNIETSSNYPIEGKGLGTSAAGGAAIAKAAFSILYNHKTEYVNNVRFQSVFSRYLSGSASRSSVGGIGLWMSSPQNDTWHSFALRLDKPQHEEFIKKVLLISIPIKSSITTSEAHKIAATSPLYLAWCLSRKNSVFDFLKAIYNEDLEKIGMLAEEDSRKLHEIHISAGLGQRYWTEETLELMNYVLKKRMEGIPLYYSIDTGPSVVLLTFKKFEEEILEELDNIIDRDLKIYKGSIGGPSKLITSDSNLAHLLDDDIEKFC
ncbi:MAG: hypothetical protein EU530_09995 [Promethearchaeota archaeon]|nr:MAG: hypothetical protein EU530_09995 [Candidatus Lokiarchaeota archaeon]